MLPGGQIIRNGVVSVDSDNGEIIEIKTLANESANIEFYNGVLVPGFVNAHCHLELCHLRGIVKDSKSLVDFLSQMFANNSAIYSDDAASQADNYMYQTGVQAVGDICNTSNTAALKQRSKIRYINFVELIGTTHARCINDITQYNNVYEDYTDHGLADDDIFAVPHSPYFVGPELFDIINDLNKDHRDMVSIHNQETREENFLYESHTGEFVGRFPIDLAPIPVTGKSSLRSMDQLVKHNYERVLLVHNIYSDGADLDFAKQSFKQPFFIVCPKSNLNLEKRIADVNLLLSKGLTICIGTDSLSSNDKLSMVEELYTLQQAFPSLSINQLIDFATINGARALGLDTIYGSLSVGKKPGIVLLENLDLANMRITPSTKSRRLV